MTWLKEILKIYLKKKQSQISSSENMKTLFLKKLYVPNWSEEVFLIKKVKSAVTCIYLIEDLNEEEIIGNVYEKELQKQTKKYLVQKH